MMRASTRCIYGTENELFLALLFGESEEREEKKDEEEGEGDDSAAAAFYLSYFSYARPSAHHRPLREED